MTLSKFYGIKPTYNAGDQKYEFSSSDGTFITDAGIDTINAYNTSKDVMIDLCPHTVTWVKVSYITDPNQLMISHGSHIENVITGTGNDTIIGTDLDNIISTGGGSDDFRRFWC